MPTGRPDTTSGGEQRIPRPSPPPLDRLPDAELVAACATGDQRAWSVLVHRYRRLIYTIPYRMGMDPADADDVFQVTFARLAPRIGKLKEPGKVRAWLVTTARRIALTAITQRRPVEDSEEILAKVTDPADLAPEEIVQLEEQQLVRIALSRLGTKCRRLLSLLYYANEGDGSYEAAARAMGIPIGSIGPTRMRCLKKLLAEYEKLERES